MAKAPEVIVTQPELLLFLEWKGERGNSSFLLIIKEWLEILLEISLGWINGEKTESALSGVSFIFKSITMKPLVGRSLLQKTATNSDFLKTRGKNRLMNLQNVGCAKSVIKNPHPT